MAHSDTRLLVCLPSAVSVPGQQRSHRVSDETHNYGRITADTVSLTWISTGFFFCLSTNIKNGRKLCLLITYTQLHVSRIIRGVFIFITHVNGLVGILSSSEGAQMFCVLTRSVIYFDRIWEILFRRQCKYLSPFLCFVFVFLGKICLNRLLEMKLQRSMISLPVRVELSCRRFVSRVLFLCLFAQTVLESRSLMMASPVQFIYSCYFPPKQNTNMCRRPGWETERERERTTDRQSSSVIICFPPPPLFFFLSSPFLNFD